MSEVIGYKLPEHVAARRAAQRRESTTQIVAVAMAIVLFLLAGVVMGPVNDIRKERQLVINPETIKGLPPEIALLGKLGTFRALVIDWACIRLERLKEEGKTYEAAALSETACSLAPRFPMLWQYAAWNMSYNISVMQFTPEARWQWVMNGIKLLRDKGIQFNPRSAPLYKELAWIYWHKIGDFLDDEHMNYKRALAVEMERVLGPPPVSLSDEEYFAWFRPIVDAPRDLSAFIAEDDEIRQLVDSLAEVGLEPDINLLDFVARNFRPELNVEDLLAEEADIDERTRRRLELLSSSDTKETADRLIAAVRSDVLRDSYKLDPEFMWTIMERYGPLDWRHAACSALYWAERGHELGRDVAGIKQNDQVFVARFILFPLQNLIGRGHMTFFPNFDEPFDSYIDLTPDTRYIPYLHDTYYRMSEEIFGDDPKYRPGTIAESFRVGFVTSMQNWIQQLYFQGGEKNMKLAEEFYLWLRDNNPEPNGRTQKQYLQPLEQFVMSDIYEQMQTRRAATSIIQNFIRQGLKAFALGTETRGSTAVARAKQCYNIWMIDTESDINDRRRLQPFPILVRDEIFAFMQAQEVDPLFKARLWQYLPIEQQQLAYDTLLPYFERLCETQDPAWDIKKAFAEPPGMEEFRRTELRLRHTNDDEGADRGTKYRE